jgi:high frequency lysogenization protein
MKNSTERLIPLAALFQVARLVNDTGFHGRINDAATEPLLQALFEFDAPSTEAVYGGLTRLRLGLDEMHQQLASADRSQLHIPQLVIAMIMLAKTVTLSNERLRAIRAGLEAVQDKAVHYPLTHDNMLAALAEIYRNNISDLSPRIMVKGDELHLQNSSNQDRIRALLLAGIRSAILWQQLGGSRWQLIWGRKKILRELADLKKHL